MNTHPVEAIAKAVLYEGYMLYPYRPSSVKNRQRFNFGVIYPRVWSESQTGSDIWTMQTECLMQVSPLTGIEVQVRFFQLVNRCVFRLTPYWELPTVTSYRCLSRRTRSVHSPLLAKTLGRGRFSSASPANGIPCSPLPSFFMTIHRSRRRARATYLMAQRSMKSSRC